MDIPQVYPESDPQTSDATQWTLGRAFHLNKIARSIILSFLELVGILSTNPAEYAGKIVHIKTLLLNAHHLINEYRPHQARESLILMMEKQIQTKRDEIEKVKSMKEKVDTLLAGLGKEDADGTSLFPQEEPAPLSPEELWKMEQRAVWAVLDEELGQ
jgi:mediator of RNA polymerase II transcription subunit 7